MNLYDFDKTICKGDSGFKFYFYFLFRHPYLFWHLFCLLFFSLAYCLKIISLSRLKEHQLSILRFSKDLQTDVSQFWDREDGKIFSYYIEQMREDDVICSASPTFLIKEIMSRINNSATCICSEIDDKTFRFKRGEENNKGVVKLRKLKSLGFNEFDKGYSDSTSDIPMLSLCKEKYKVKCGKVTKFDEKYFQK